MRRLRIFFLCFYIGNAILFGGALAAIAFLPSPKSPYDRQIRLGYSAEAGSLADLVVPAFNQASTLYRIDAVALESVEEVDAVLVGSTIWLDAIDRSAGRPVVAEVARFAASPIVIDVPDFVARDVRSWQSFFARAPGLRWARPDAGTTSGLLTLTAAFGPGRLTVDDVDRNRDRVAALLRSARPDDGTIDVTITGEQAYVARQAANRVAVFPAEGTFWLDYPIARIDRRPLRDDQVAAYRTFVDYLRSPETQRRLAEAGYRPVGPFTPVSGVNLSQPQATLAVPSPAVIDRIVAFSRE